MDSLEDQLARSREHLTPEWSEVRARRVLTNTRAVQQGRKHRRQRGLPLAFATLAAAAGALVAYRENHIAPQEAVAVSPTAEVDRPSAPTAPDVPLVPAGPPRALADGSHLKSYPGARVRILKNRPKRIAVAVDQGKAHFDVVHDEQRWFEVHFGNSTLTVLGTIFDVEHGPNSVTVSVSRGRVRVDGPDGSAFVSAGQLQKFSLQGAPLEGNGEVIEPVTREESANQDKSPHPYRQWRSYIAKGDYRGAYRAMRAARRYIIASPHPAILLDAADTARLSGHPAEATEYLAKVTRQFPRSPMAPLAAFTLGRVCLDELGQPYRAAEAFALARRLAPQGSLAQDALAREVEALSKGGREHDAFLRAQEYLRRYPKGRRVQAVKAHGKVN